jgi:hypothetical protein
MPDGDHAVLRSNPQHIDVAWNSIRRQMRWILLVHVSTEVLPSTAPVQQQMSPALLHRRPGYRESYSSPSPTTVLDPERGQGRWVRLG